MENGALQVPTVADEVYKRLRIRIVQGKLLPGQKVTIRHIADEFGVSTMPVRESLKRLQVEGFVRYKRRSVVVNKLSTIEVKEVFEIRKQLEGMAIAWALPNITKDNEEELENILREMDEILTDPIEWERLNKKFHLTLYSFSNSKPLNQLLKQVWGNVEPYMHIYSLSRSDYSLQTSQGDHYKILQYIKEKQQEKLTDLTVKHLSYTCDVILKEISEQEQV